MDPAASYTPRRCHRMRPSLQVEAIDEADIVEVLATQARRGEQRRLPSRHVPQQHSKMP